MISLLCIAAMLMMTVPALANPSVAVTVISETEGVTVTALAEGTIEEIASESAQTIVETVNGQGSMTPADAIHTALENATEDEKEELVAALNEVQNYSFTSQFNEMRFDGDSKDVVIAGTNQNTRIMLINPETGEIVILKPDENGVFHFPFPGLFAMMDPTPVG